MHWILKIAAIGLAYGFARLIVAHAAVQKGDDLVYPVFI